MTTVQVKVTPTVIKVILGAAQGPAGASGGGGGGGGASNTDQLENLSDVPGGTGTEALNALLGDVSAKADSTDVATELALKADQADLDSLSDDTGEALALKANTSDVETALAGKAAVSHAHAESDITGLTADLAAKADAAATTTALAGKAAVSHSHAESDITGLSADLAAKADAAATTTALAGKAAASHTHAESDVTGLTADLAAKAATTYVDTQDAATLAAAKAWVSTAGHSGVYTDLTSRPTLGTAALKNVGTTSGDVAAGDAPATAAATAVAAIPNATDSQTGLMTSTDHTKLTGIETGAQVTSAARVVTALASAASDINVNAQEVKNAKDPTTAQSLATRNYVDTTVYAGVNAQTASYTLVASDKGKLVPVTSAFACAVTIPPVSSVSRTAGDWVDIARTGAGSLQFLQGAGVSFIGARSWFLRMGGKARATYVGSDTWLISGDDLMPVSGMTYPNQAAPGGYFTNSTAGGFAGAATGWVMCFLVYLNTARNDNQILGYKGNVSSLGWQIQNLSGWTVRVANGSGVIVQSPVVSVATASLIGKAHSLCFAFDNTNSLVRSWFDSAQVGSGTACVGYTPAPAIAMNLCPQSTTLHLTLLGASFGNGAYSSTDILAWEAASKAARKAMPLNGTNFTGRMVYNPMLSDVWPGLPEELGGASNDYLMAQLAIGARPVLEEIRNVQFAF